MQVKPDEWTLRHLRQHLQYAVDLEFWTIPFYMSAMYSIVDRSAPAFQRIQSIVNQEMLHTQLAANIANAYGLEPRFGQPKYEGTTVPHLDFCLDPEIPKKYFPYSAEIGPLDQLRIHAMCLIEYPEWETGKDPDYKDTTTEYGSIGEFYDAVARGAKQLKDDLRGGVNQVDHFAAFYRDMPVTTVSSSGEEGWYQAAMLIDAIRNQGEGAERKEEIAPSFRNTADDSEPKSTHFEKFEQILNANLPLVYPQKDKTEYRDHDTELLEILRRDFKQLRSTLADEFAGKNPGNFLPLMITVGADISRCWQSGVTPNFNPPAT